ncbi:MAG: AgmX/PglI C-terminal domain-containing protein [Myxococcales bacterium]|nr:AgmX/PglI C-terminal domain-containing protein [Myxococcales bacterium]
MRTLSEDDDALRKARCRGRDCFGGLPRRRDHRPEGPTFREVAKPDQGGGTLPSELIQRVVHASFGRFRACYQTGLLQNPSLAGRVVVRFLIGRDGRVMSAADGGSDLPDRGVVSCIASSFQALTFPAPERGTVTVTYPFALTPPQ